MKQVYIIYRTMFDADGNMPVVGGIENYITSLIDELSPDYGMHVVQPAKAEFNVQLSNCTVHGVITGQYRGNAKKHALAKWVQQHASAEDIVIFATDSYCTKMNNLTTVAIQHGISWDKPRKQPNRTLQLFNSFTRQLKYLGYVKHAPNLVCVDHNFVNWYRTWLNAESHKIKVIYNFYQQRISQHDFEQKWQQLDEINIIIARRFVDYRGIKFIAPIIEQLCQQSLNINVTFAGEGPLETDLKQRFLSYNNVNICQYLPNESYAIHAKQHIAIIPTLGSEGTSLSMIEAMAAGCAVIASNVGGLSNLIIDGYNGRLIMPDAEQMQASITALVSQPEQAKALAENGLNSISHVCNKAHWGQQWRDYLQRLN
ncbi:glycosyltransferase family 4 protein [Shewanella maritima]|uniref:glycosyltransferase family 4 protein n=1 Tax=Shewanella maritima TaxID=2520507 RepID=UPI0037365BDD